VIEATRQHTPQHHPELANVETKTFGSANIGLAFVPRMRY
jgi:hypothetical protein